MHVVVQVAAQLRAQEIAYEIAIHHVNAAHRFLLAVRETHTTIGRIPGIGTERFPRDRSLKGLRSVAVSGFKNYLVFWVVVRDEVRILWIDHAARDLDQLWGLPLNP